ncbi:hypothetical protein DPMN_029189 [Dreissena polymorpha]|uniref:Uncharacterized protein n=1 Tax=Dreissena polymorpha TaxID=45954 RepID=A0A9D4LW07_DREPO|nr:hypothetical protein DPMN_029189 [Dreissena polymorpha]
MGKHSSVLTVEKKVPLYLFAFGPYKVPVYVFHGFVLHQSSLEDEDPSQHQQGESLGSGRC